jgi:hypothetical protein
MHLHDTHGGVDPLLDDGPAFELGDGRRLSPHLTEAATDIPPGGDAADLIGEEPDGDDSPGATDPMQDHLQHLVHILAEREHLVEQIISEIDEAIGGLHSQDVTTLHHMLRAPSMTPEALRSLHTNGVLVTHAKGLAYDRLASQGAAQTPAPITPGGGISRDSLTVDELRRIKELAPRLNVPVEELKAQYTARKRQSA